MNKAQWEIWIEDEKKVERDFKSYLKRKAIRKGATTLEVQGHLQKAKRNLRFARSIIDDLKDFYEWSLVTYYYAVYQSALALCATKGYKTKSHQATLCILIKFFYPKHISQEDLKKVLKTMVAEDDIKEFVELKGYREDATYLPDEHREKLRGFAQTFVEEKDTIFEGQREAVEAQDTLYDDAFFQDAQTLRQAAQAISPLVMHTSRYSRLLGTTQQALLRQIGDHLREEFSGACLEDREGTLYVVDNLGAPYQTGLSKSAA